MRSNQTAGNLNAITTAAAVKSNQYTHVVAQWGPPGMSIWTNGVRSSTNSFAGAIVSLKSQVVIGYDLAESKPYYGVLDEFRATTNNLSADWIWSEYHNVTDAGNQQIWGLETAAP